MRSCHSGSMCIENGDGIASSFMDVIELYSEVRGDDGQDYGVSSVSSACHTSQYVC